MVLQISHSSKVETTKTNIAEMSTHSPTYTCIYLYKDMKTSCPYGFPIIVLTVLTSLLYKMYKMFLLQYNTVIIPSTKMYKE